MTRNIFQKYVSNFLNYIFYKKNISLQKYLEKLSSYMPGNFYWKDKEGRYLGCNKIVLKTIAAKSFNDIVGKTDYDLWPDQADLLRKNDEEVMSSGNLMSFEEMVSLQNMENKYFTVIKSPLVNKAGSVIGIIGNSIEITAIKKNQLLLESAKKNIEQQNKIITQELRNLVGAVPGSIY